MSKRKRIAQLERASKDRVVELSAPCGFVVAEAAAGAAAPAPRFTMDAYNGGAVELAGWPLPVVIDVGGVKAGPSTPIRRNHDKNRVVGHVTDLARDGAKGTIRASGVLSVPNADRAEIIDAVANGFPWQASVGVRASRVETVRQGASAQANGRTFQGPVDIIREGFLGEISILDWGADSTTRVNVAAEADERRPELALAERDAGDAAGDPPESDIQAEIAEHKARRKRDAELAAVTRRFLDDPGIPETAMTELTERARSESWTPARLELEFYRASRGRAPAAHVRHGNGATTMALCAAALLGLGVPMEFVARQKEFDERTLDVADKFRSVTLHGLIGYALESVGVRCQPGGVNVWDAYAAHFQKLAEAGTSSGVNMPNLIGTAGAKLLLNAFLAVPVAYRDICQIRELTSFLTHKVYRMDHRGGWHKVGANGELAKGALEESGATNTLDTWGQVVTLDRKHIINDDLGAFADLLASHGRQAAIAAEYAVIDALCEPSDSFFNASGALINKLSPGSMNLAAIQAAEALLAKQLDVNGMPIFAMPDRIIAPPSLRATADQFWTSAQVSADATSSGTAVQRPTDNPYKGRLRPISTPMLELASIAGSSAATWYLMANPEIVPTLQFATLVGKPEPTLERKEAEVGRLGMSVQGYWDFGVAQIDGRGCIKNA